MSHTIILEKILCSDWCFSYVSVTFKIRNDTTGDECVYTQTLGFGSSYTLLILPTLKYGPNVTLMNTSQYVLSHNMA